MLTSVSLFFDEIGSDVEFGDLSLTFAAVARNTHLRALKVKVSLLDTFVFGCALPAVRANTSLRRLVFDPRNDLEVQEAARDMMRVVAARTPAGP